VEGAYEYLNAEVPEIIAIPDDELWADIKDIKDLTGAIGKRSFGGSLRSKSKYMNQQEPTYKIDTAIRNTAHGLVCRVSVMGKLIIKEAPVTNFDDKKPEFLDVTQAIYLEAYGYNSALTDSVTETLANNSARTSTIEPILGMGHPYHHHLHLHLQRPHRKPQIRGARKMTRYAS